MTSRVIGIFVLLLWSSLSWAQDSGQAFINQTFTGGRNLMVFPQPGFESLDQYAASGDRSQNITVIYEPTEFTVTDMTFVDGKPYYKVKESLSTGWVSGRVLEPFLPGCSRVEPSLSDQAQGLNDIAEHLGVHPGRLRVPALTQRFRKNGADCSSLIKGEGELGPMGEMLVKEMLGQGKADVDTNHFLNPPKGYFDRVCPKFDGFSMEAKLSFWVWTFTALAWDESTCVSNRVGQGIHSRASGLFQVPERWSNDRELRGPGCSADPPPVKGYNYRGSYQGNFWMADWKDNIPCAVQIMNGVLCGAYSRTGRDFTTCRPESKPKAFFGRRSQQYWQKAKNSHRKLMKLMGDYPGCK